MKKKITKSLNGEEKIRFETDNNKIMKNLLDSVGIKVVREIARGGVYHVELEDGRIATVYHKALSIIIKGEGKYNLVDFLVENYNMTHMGIYNVVKNMDLNLASVETRYYSDLVHRPKLLDFCVTKKRISENVYEFIEQIKIDLSNDSTLRMKFGKHIGKTIDEILKIEPSYIDWVINNLKDRDFADAVANEYEKIMEKTVS